MKLFVAVLVAALFPIITPALSEAAPPVPPGNFGAYSQYTTKTTMRLTWTDPTLRTNGDPIGLFEIQIFREDTLRASVGKGNQTYLDSNLMDGQYYVYELRARDLSTGEVSAAVTTGWHAGGDPVPAPPTQLTVTPTLGGYRLNWRNPSTQRDGTPFDDFGGVRIRRKGAYVSFLPANSSSFIDVDAPIDSWWDVSVVDNERMANASEWSETVYAPPAEPDVRMSTNRIELTGPVRGRPITASLSIDNLGALNLPYTVEHASDWLRVAPENGTVPAFGNLQIGLTADPADLSEGVRVDTLVFRSNDPDSPRIDIPVIFDLRATRMVLLPEALAFSILVIDEVASLDLIVRNEGPWELEYALSSESPWLTIGAGTNKVPAGSQTIRRITATRTTQPLGRFTDSLVVISNDIDSPRVVIPVTLDVTTSPPRLDVDTTGVNFTVYRGDGPAIETLTITNGGVESLLLSATSDAGLFSVSPSAAILPPRTSLFVRITAATDGLALDSYSGHLILESNDPDRARVTIPLTLTLLDESPRIALAPVDTVRFTNVGCNNASRSMSIRNDGHRPLGATLTGDVPWLSFIPSNVTVPAHSSMYVEVHVTSTLMPRGANLGRITVHSNAPENPAVMLPVIVPRFVSVASAETQDLFFVTSVYGVPVTRTFLVTNTGNSTLTIRPPTSPAAPPWLLVSATLTLQPGASGEVRITALPGELDAGEYRTVLNLVTNSCDGPLPIRIRFDINPGPPEFRATREIVEIDAGEKAPITGSGLDLANYTTETVQFEVEESAPWLLVEPRSGHILAGRVLQLNLSVAPGGLAPGVHTSLVRITSDDPVNPEQTVTIQLNVRPHPPDVDHDLFGVRELLTSCRNGQTSIQFVELAAFSDDAIYRSTIGLQIENAKGEVVLDHSDLFSPEMEGQPWPRNESWLLTTAAGIQAGINQDRIIAAVLDRSGGTITVYAGTEKSVIQRFSYGVVSGANSPPPGMSLQRVAPGEFALSETPTPQRSNALTHAQMACACPVNTVSAGPSLLNSSNAVNSTSYNTGQRFATSSYDLRSGLLRASARGAVGNTTTRDVFVVTGDRYGVPVSFEAVLKVTGRVSSTSLPPFPATFLSASLGRDGLEAARSMRRQAPGDPELVDGEVVLTVRAQHHVPFELLSGIVASDATATGHAIGEARLEFRGLPPGVRISSCQSFRFAADSIPGPTVIESGVSRGAVRVAWLVPGGPRLVNVERRADGGNWITRGSAEASESGRVEFEDSAVRIGGEYDYRVRYAESTGGEVSVTIPGPLTLALVPTVPNPARDGRLRFTVALPDDQAARIELFDVAGRRISVTDLAGSGPGEIEVDMTEERPLASGVYLVRLVQGKRAVSVKAVVIR